MHPIDAQVPPGGLKMFLIDDGVEKMGISLNYFIGHFASFDIASDQSVNMGVTQKVNFLEPTKFPCRSDFEFVEYTDCVVERFAHRTVSFII